MTTESPRGIDRAPVDAWIAANVAGAVAPFSYELIAAGGSNLTFRVTDGGGRQWALRRPPVGHALPTAHDMSREWRIMEALAETVPVPECVAYCGEPEVNGAPFYLMSFVEGRILRDQASTSDMDAAQAEVATESLSPCRSPCTRWTSTRSVSASSPSAPTTWAASSAVGAVRSSEPASGNRPLMLELHDRLVAAKPDEKAAPGIVHGDYRFDNTVLGDDFRIAAVLDWELSTIGDPIADFAWSLQYWADPGDPINFLNDPPTLNGVFVRRDEVARRYAERSGFDLSDLPYFTVFSWWKQACIVEGVYARRLKGATGGAAGTNDPNDVARRADALFARAAELATGVV